MPAKGLHLFISKEAGTTPTGFVSYSEKAMAPHSSTLAWKIPWTEEPGRLQSMGFHRVGHDQATSLHSLHSLHTLLLEKEMATHSCSCLENPRDGGVWWDAVYGVAQSDVTEAT